MKYLWLLILAIAFWGCVNDQGDEGEETITEEGVPILDYSNSLEDITDAPDLGEVLQTLEFEKKELTYIDSNGNTQSDSLRVLETEGVKDTSLFNEILIVKKDTVSVDSVAVFVEGLSEVDSLALDTLNAEKVEVSQYEKQQVLKEEHESSLGIDVPYLSESQEEKVGNWLEEVTGGLFSGGSSGGSSDPKPTSSSSSEFVESSSSSLEELKLEAKESGLPDFVIQNHFSSPVEFDIWVGDDLEFTSEASVRGYNLWNGVSLGRIGTGLLDSQKEYSLNENVKELLVVFGYKSGGKPVYLTHQLVIRGGGPLLLQLDKEGKTKLGQLEED